MRNQMKLPLDQLEKLLDTLKERDVSEFDYEDEDFKLRLTIGGVAPLVSVPPPVSVASVSPSAPAAAESEAEEAGVQFVTSPFVGTFYRAPSPEAEPFIEVGSAVSKGQTLCIVEAMKLMNEIEADCSGKVVEVLVENGMSVEFGQKLFKIKA